MKDDGSICTSSDPCPCDTNGVCTCGTGFKGGKCDECDSGYYDLDGNESNSIATCTGILSNNQPYIYWTQLINFLII